MKKVFQGSFSSIDNFVSRELQLDMEAIKYSIEYYINPSGGMPFIEWLESFRDKRIKHRIQERLNRVLLGNLGDHRALGDGVSELRLDFGAGYRIYYGMQEKKIVLLLCGGDKSSQEKDIKKAKIYWEDYLLE